MTRRKLPPTTGPGPMPPTPDMNHVGYSVVDWSSDPVPGRSPPEAVVLMLHTRELGYPVALRLKSRAAVDQLIDTLERHAVSVWPRNP